MRNAVLALALVVLGGTAAPGQSERWAEKLFREGGTRHEFGSVPRGALLHHRFPVTNIYAVPLNFTSIRTSCGCVQCTPSTETLQPREKGYLDVTMDTRRFTGPKTVSIFVTVGPQFISTATLQVSGNSRADVVFNPGEVNFGLVQRGQTPSQVIDVDYAGPLDWRITGVANNGAPVDVSVEENTRRPGRVSYRLKVTLQSDAKPGTHKYDIYLKTNDPASPLVPLLVEFSVQASLSVVPGTLNLGGLQVGQATLRRVVVRGSKPFRILAIEGTGDGLTAEPPASAAEVHIVTFKFLPQKPGELRRQILVKTDLDGDASATVVVEGNVLP